MTTHDVTHLRPDDQIEPPQEPAAPKRPTGARAVLAVARNLWRQLTSMRVALILLFLLALASLPGALLPQWNLNQANTAQYILDNPTVGPILDRLGFFGVFGSPWYAAIYLALFTSLIGCLVPRTWDFIGVLRSKPVQTPRNLGRLPHHEVIATDSETPAVAADRITAGLKRWRLSRRDEPNGVLTISAEKGFVREVGNLLFHFSLLGLLGAIAVGKMFGFEGTVVVTEGGGFCSSSPSVYSTFRPGLLVDGTQLAPFCVDVDAFDAVYTESGQATDFDATIRYQSGVGAAVGAQDWTSTHLKVNDPLRINGERLYLLGHGFAPTFQVTFPNGQVRTATQTFEPRGPTLLSEGVVKFLDPPGYSGAEVTQHQLALQGLFAPTSGFTHDNILTSIRAAPDDPGVAIQVYRGDLGMEGGASQSIFALDERQIDSGALVKLNRANLMLGESMKLDDGTSITFTGYKQWVQLQTSYDPAQGFALVFAITLLGGLMLSLTIKRRRVWYRIAPAGSDADGCRIEIGGLARTDQAGYGEEFSSLVLLAARPPTDVRAATGRR